MSHEEGLRPPISTGLESCGLSVADTAAVLHRAVAGASVRDSRYGVGPRAGAHEGPLHAKQVAAEAKWLMPTIAEVRGGRDCGCGYRLEIRCGLRVDVTPLTENLLARVVFRRLGG